MKVYKTIWALAVFLLASRIAYSQHDVGPIILDSSFASSGISEIDFNGHNDDVTAFDIIGGKVATNRSILVGGKVSMSLDGTISFGMVQYTSSGTLDMNFGTQGRKVQDWPGINYPNAITLYPNTRLSSSDTMILAAGASSNSADSTRRMPLLCRFKTNGDPDSTFGNTGRVIQSFDGASYGECTNAFRIEVGYAVACGYNFTTVNNQTGFGAFWVDRNGRPDSNFGSNGSMFLPAAIRYATGYFTDDLKLVFVGISSTGSPEIILAKLTEKGLPDSSFGINGIKATGIILKNDRTPISAYLHSTFDNSGEIVIAAALEDTSVGVPFSLIMFKAATGDVDSSYGTGGRVSMPMVGNLKPFGIIISNDGSALVAARSGEGLGKCAAAKISINGSIDTTFGIGGIAIVDAFDGVRENYLVGFNSIGGKKFIGVGVAEDVSGKNFLVTRYRQLFPSGVPVSSANNDGLRLYPNPVKDLFYLEVPTGLPIDHISIVDPLGKVFLSFNANSVFTASNSYIVDASDLPAGYYNCLVTTRHSIHLSTLIVTR